MKPSAYKFGFYCYSIALICLSLGVVGFSIKAKREIAYLREQRNFWFSANLDNLKLRDWSGIVDKEQWNSNGQFITYTITVSNKFWIKPLP